MVVDITKNIYKMEAKQFINENKGIVPLNQRKKFETLTEEQKVAKINFYKDIIKMRAEAREKNKIVNKVRELFDRRKATKEDANEVLKFCEEFIESFKTRQIEALNMEIARLEEEKAKLT